MSPQVTASRKSIAAVADPTAIARVKSDTGVPSPVISRTDVSEKMRLQFVGGRLICASIKSTVSVIAAAAPMEQGLSSPCFALADFAA